MKSTCEPKELSNAVARITKRDGFFLLSILILLSYSNTFNASWHLDDYPQIVDRASRYLHHVDFDSLFKFLFASNVGIGSTPDRSFRIYRPISRLTLAANWLSSGNEVAGYHAVNICIHILTAFLLYSMILRLHRSMTPERQNGCQNEAQCVALLSAILWAINPIQTQAVTYIVQRMASLAAMFYVWALLMYLKLRFEPDSHKKILYFLAIIFFYLLAVGSKQNAIIMPLSIVLMELIFFSDISSCLKNSVFFFRIACLFVAIGILGGLIIYDIGGVSAILNAYSEKHFTLWERVMTQPRILLFYISQIFYPIPQRLSLEHHIVFSKSLITPWTTLPAILSVMILIFAALLFCKKWPILSFGIIFYFLNHAIESTILPLEMVFEHRNYLPSLFLFYPVVVGVFRIIEHNGISPLKPLLKGAVVLVVIFLMVGTYVRNQTWVDERSLWRDALEKAPQNMRPYQNLAASYYEEIGDYNAAMDLYQKAIGLPGPQPEEQRAVALNNIGAIYLKKGEYEKALIAFQKAAALMPEFEHPRYGIPLAFAEMGRNEEALTHLNEILSTIGYDKEKYLNLTGAILINQGRYKEAIFYLNEALRLSPPRRITLLRLGMAFSKLGRCKKAEIYLKYAEKHAPKDMETTLCLIENYHREENHGSVEFYLRRLLREHPIGKIKETLDECYQKRLSPPMSCEFLLSLISKRIKTPSTVFLNSFAL